MNSLMDVMHGTEVVDQVRFSGRPSGGSCSRSQDIRDVKIVNQAKKIRNMNVALNRERGRVAALEEKVKKTKEELEVVSSAGARAAATKGRNSTPLTRSEEGVENATQQRKIEELRTRLDKVNAELRRTQKVLAREVRRCSVP